MKKWQNFAALKRVKLEVETLAAGLAGALEKVIATPVGEAKQPRDIAASLAAFSRVPGILRLLELPHLAWLAEDIGHGLMDLLDPQDGLTAAAIDARLEAAFVAVCHLAPLQEQALAGGGDDFEHVFALLNRVRDRRGAALVFGTRVLAEREGVRLRHRFTQRPGEFRRLMQKQSVYLNKACALLRRDSANPQARKVLQKVAANLALLLRDYRAGTLWGMARVLADHYAVAGQCPPQAMDVFAALAGLTGQLDEGSIPPLDQVPDDALVRKLLVLLEPLKADVAEAARMLRWHEKAGEPGRAHLEPWFGKAALVTCLDLVRKRFAELQDDIDHMAEKDRLTGTGVAEIHNDVCRLMDILAFLGFSAQARELDRVLAVSPADAPRDVLYRTASVLFAASRELAGVQNRQALDVFGATLADGGRASLDTARLQTLRAAADELETVIGVLDAHTENNGDNLREAASGLARLSRVFTMLGFGDAAAHIALAGRYTARLAQAAPDQAGVSGFQTLCHLVVNGLWYLDQLALGRDADSFFYLARSAEYAQGLEGFLDELEEADAIVLLSEVTVAEEQDAEVRNPAAQDAGMEEAQAQEDSDDIRAIFAAECEEILGQLEAACDVLEQQPGAPEVLADCRRHFHTLKGSSRMVGEEGVAVLAETMEDLFARLAGQTLVLDASRLALTRNVTGALRVMDAGLLAQLYEQVQAGLQAGADSAGAEQATPEPVIAGFLSEARELLSRLAPGNGIAAMRQALHLLEGAADAAGLEPFKAVALALHALCGRIDASQPVPETTQAILDAALAWMRAGIAHLAGGGELDATGDVLAMIDASSPAPADTGNDEEEPVDQSLLAVFLDEVEELLQDLDGHFLAWQGSPADGTPRAEYLRILHTLKGSAALARDEALSRAAHDYETFVVQAGTDSGAFDAGFFAACDSRLHGLHNLLGRYSHNGGLIERTEELPQPAADMAHGPETAAVEEKKTMTAAEEQVRVSSQLLKFLLNDADEINFSRNRMEKNFRDINTLLVDMDETLARLKSYARRFEENARQGYRNHEDNTVRTGARIADDFDDLEMDRYNELQEMSLALTEDYEDLQEIRTNLAGRLREIDGVLAGQQRLTNSLQDGLISSQMLPFASILPRLRRLARQVSRELGKDVRVEVENQQGMLDKNILQAIITPLEHILRNAIDHGIEAPDARQAAGKDRQAVIAIRVARQGASIRIEISDDGRGVDIDKVRRRAIDKGLLAPDSAAADEDVCQLIFAPGFSTADSVSKISGRGVGLDVVKNQVAQIGGSVELFTEGGKGTGFILHLPLTSSLNRALLFDIQGTPFVVLMNTLDGVLVEKLGSVYRKQAEGVAPEFGYGEKSYEYLYLGKLLEPGCQPRPDSVDSAITLLLVSGRKKNFALHIDGIIESRDLVVKSFGKQFSSMPGIGGGVLMPDGSVAIVLDLKDLVNLHAEQDREKRGPATATVFMKAGGRPEGRKRKTVLVVDDSITVRKVTTSILSRNGLDVITAKNGLEAIELLQTHIPDVILLDIEMPKMDGFEVATHIRSQEPPVRDIPIIMITSRIGDKHRSRAEKIGVNEYLCKPFQEKNLLATIDSFQPVVKQEPK